MTADGSPPELRARIEMTVSCHDSDAIAKVPHAGEVHDGVQVMHNGVRIEAGSYCGDWMTEVIARLRGHHEPQEEVAFHAVVERAAATESSPVMVELGAYWGYYSLWLLHRAPGGRAVLIEPDPEFLAAGRRNFALNGKDGVFLQAAVGAAPTGPVPFRCESDQVVRPVPTESLPSLLERFGIDRADVVLADVQGAELALLEGAREVLVAGRVRFLVVSTHHHSISGDPETHRRCLDLIVDCGAHVVTEHTVAESFSGDGLIVAAFDPCDFDLVVPVSRARASSSLFGDPTEEVARSWRELAVARAEERATAEELRAAREGAAALRRELDAVRAGLEAAQLELAHIGATRTWQLRNRVVASLGRRRSR